MTAFTPAELEYLAGQQLGRIATSDARGQPHVVPTAFAHELSGDTIRITGHGMADSKKFRDVTTNPRAAFVVDDVPTGAGWQPRGIEVRGSAQALTENGEAVIRIQPVRIVSWGIDTDSYSRNARTVDVPS